MKEEKTKKFARLALIAACIAIGVGYAAAFMPGGTPAWAPWLLAFGIPVSFVGIMVMGAVRNRDGIRKLAFPFLFVGAFLIAGFCLALALPNNESGASRLILGLPLRAAIIVYGVGLLPIIVLPIAYALTFETQTLDPEDLEKVKQLGAAYKRARQESRGQ